MTDKIIKKTKKDLMIRRQYSLQSIKEDSIMRLLYDIIIFSMVEIMIRLKNFLMTQKETEMNIVFS